MWKYTFQKLASLLPKLLLLAVLTFFVLRLAPGGPFDTDQSLPEGVRATIQAQYGLDQPILAQFLRWLTLLMQGNLGESFQYLSRPVSEMIFESLIPSVEIGGLALLLSLVLGIPIGCLAAAKQNTIWDTSAMIAAVAGMSLPSYLTASLLILVFSSYLGWLPPALWESPSSIVLPVATLMARPLAVVAKMIRASMIEALQSDYIRTAYAKGQIYIFILFKHALRNSLIPMLSMLGPLAANLVTGSIAVEYIFQIPGMGKHFVAAVTNRDYPLVMGVTLTYGVILVIFNLITDLVGLWSDPRTSV